MNFERRSDLVIKVLVVLDGMSWESIRVHIMNLLLDCNDCLVCEFTILEHCRQTLASKEG